jgi:ABC-type uncharacterized transport system ATPase component
MAASLFPLRAEERSLVSRSIDVFRIRTLSIEQHARGIDIGAKAEVHALMAELAEQGVGMLMISSELPEILGMSHRVLVMRNSRIVAEVPRARRTDHGCRHWSGGSDHVGQKLFIRKIVLLQWPRTWQSPAGVQRR